MLRNLKARSRNIVGKRNPRPYPWRIRGAKLKTTSRGEAEIHVLRSSEGEAAMRRSREKKKKASSLWEMNREQQII